MTKADFAEHLRFFQELGVTGIECRRRRERRRGSSRDVFPVAGRAFRRQSDAPARFVTKSATARAASCIAWGARQIVFGVGNPSADLMFVGEAPGADEDVQGIPFVGRAGQLLTKIIEAIGLHARRRVHRQRDQMPSARESQSRAGRSRDLRAVPVSADRHRSQPKVIVALGTFAAKALLKTQDPISRLRGRTSTTIAAPS